MKITEGQLIALVGVLGETLKYHYLDMSMDLKERKLLYQAIIGNNSQTLESEAPK
jgi:hypothetical protein